MGGLRSVIGVDIQRGLMGMLLVMMLETTHLAKLCADIYATVNLVLQSRKEIFPRSGGCL
jgi:hypothetical protein